MNNVIFADAHEHAIKTVPEMTLVYNKQATLLNIVKPGGNKIDAFLDWETGRVYMKHFQTTVSSGKSEIFELNMEENGNQHCYEIQMSLIDNDRVIVTARDLPEENASQLE